MQDLPIHFEAFLQQRWRKTNFFGYLAEISGLFALLGIAIGIHFGVTPLPLGALTAGVLVSAVICGLPTLLNARNQDLDRRWIVMADYLVFAAAFGALGGLIDLTLEMPAVITVGFAITATWGIYPQTRAAAILRPAATWFTFGCAYAITAGPIAFAPKTLVLHALAGLGGSIAAALTSHNLWDSLRQLFLTNEKLDEAVNEARAGTRAKSEFLANMSHEIRTPMNGVIGMVSLLERSEMDEEQTACVGLIRESGSALLGILDDILDLSKIEAGKMTVEDVSFELRRVVNGVVRLVSGTKYGKGLQLGATVAPEVPDAVIGDPTRLRQILMNLVGNAAKFTEEGSVSVKVDLSEDRGEQVLVRLRVRDTGIGMSQEQQDRLFKAFSQADNSMTRRFGGTGLGLVISQQLCVMMGGEISVRSQPGVGSEFCFTVLLQRNPEASEEGRLDGNWLYEGEDLSEGQPEGDGSSEEPTARESTAAAPAAGSEAGDGSGAAETGADSDESAGADQPHHVLLVEDNPVNQMLAKKILKKLGKEVTLAKDGQEAVEAFAPGRYDLVLMDCQMPRLDGRSATREIRKIENGDSHVPVVALTANAMAGDRESMIEAGMDDYLAKPFELEQLQGMLDKWLPIRCQAPS